MEPLYTAKTQCTWPEYWKLNQAALLRRKPTLALCMLLIALFVLLSVLRASVVPLLLCVLFFAVYFLLLRATARRSFQSNRIMRDETLHYAFFADHFEASYSQGQTSVAYDQLFAVWETSTNFYLMISRNQGYLLSKANCSPELIAFLQGKGAKKI